MHPLIGQHIIITDAQHPFVTQSGIVTDADSNSLVVRLNGSLIIHVVVREGQYEIVKGEGNA
jgi:hypothetical protein